MMLSAAARRDICITVMCDVLIVIPAQAEVRYNGEAGQSQF